MVKVFKIDKANFEGHSFSKIISLEPESSHESILRENTSHLLHKNLVELDIGPCLPWNNFCWKWNNSTSSMVVTRPLIDFGKLESNLI